MTKTLTGQRRLGIVGCGAIGSLVARLLEKRRSSFRITAVFDADTARARGLSQSLKSRPKICVQLAQLLSQCDVVLEAASVEAALPVAMSALRRRKSVVLMSTGAFLLNRKRLSDLARKYRTKIYLPSGALCGLDGLKAARQIGRIKELKITSTKPPEGFRGAPGLTLAQKRSLHKSQKAFYLYKGDVWGAIRRFPANVNVAATAALASGYPEKLKVWIMADPKIKRNQHVIHLAGDFGELTAMTRNVPSKENPRTSALAIQAALALFERLESFVEVGN